MTGGAARRAREGRPRVWLLSILLLSSACASSGRPVPAPFPRPGGGRPAPAPATSSVIPADLPDVVRTALSLRGVPYRNGGADPSGFDCSGLVAYVFAQHGIPLPRTAYEQFERGERVDRGPLQPGDLVFFTTIAPGPSHVGIVVSGYDFVHAPSARGVVRVESMMASYWKSRYLGARRIR